MILLANLEFANRLFRHKRATDLQHPTLARVQADTLERSLLQQLRQKLGAMEAAEYQAYCALLQIAAHMHLVEENNLAMLINIQDLHGGCKCLEGIVHQGSQDL